MKYRVLHIVQTIHSVYIKGHSSKQQPLGEELQMLTDDAWVQTTHIGILWMQNNYKSAHTRFVSM